MAIGVLLSYGKAQFFSDAGATLAAGSLYTYQPGTTTTQPTYSDSDLAVAHQNSNPVTLDSAGRATVYLDPTLGYKFLLKDSAGATIWTQDDGFLPTAGILDIAGTAGEAISAGDAVYLSDGSGSLTAGRWYKADADLVYASQGMVGIAPAAISSAASGTIRLAGRLTGLSALTTGSRYYLSGTAGALTATAPQNPRLLGMADSTTSLVYDANPPRGVGNPAICQGRLTLETGVAVSTTDQSAKTSLFFTPYQGNQVALYNGTIWTSYTFTEKTLSLAGLTASTPYDIFLQDVSGTLTLSATAWTNTTTRATALVLQDGISALTGTLTKRYLGTIYINASGGQTDDALAKRYVWNVQNRALRPMRVLEATNSWTYTSATWRQLNNAAGNKLEVVQGLAEEVFAARVDVTLTNSSAAQSSVSIGEDSVTVPSTAAHATAYANSVRGTVVASILITPAIGYHYYAALESAGSAGTTTSYGDDGGTLLQSGISGSWRC